MRLFLLLTLLSGLCGPLFLCGMEQKTINLADLTITCLESDYDATDDAPARHEIVLDVMGGQELLMMPYAIIEINTYEINHDTDMYKMVTTFGKDHEQLFTIHKHKPLVYLRYFEIYEDHNKNQGLGKQLFLYTLIQVRKRCPESLYFWKAQPLDGNHKKQDLFRFYKHCGGTLLKEDVRSAIFYIDLAKLDLGIFKPQKEFLQVHSRL